MDTCINNHWKETETACACPDDAQCDVCLRNVSRQAMGLMGMKSGAQPTYT